MLKCELEMMCLHVQDSTVQTNESYCRTGNVNEQVMLTNLTSGMGSLTFLHVNNYMP